MDLGLRNKRALVTGGGTGIGKAIAEELAKEGARVAITSRNSEHVQEALAVLGGEEAGHYGFVCEITEEGAPQEAAGRVQARFGTIDILVNNVGSTLDVVDPYCPISDWRKVVRLNLEVAIELNNSVLPAMKAQDWGRIVTITSDAALENSGPVTFCASKAALGAYTRAMGRVLATETSNVVMTALMPGVVYTEEGHWATVLRERPEHAERYLRERCPLNRLGQPSEISGMVAFLCSEHASFCQGAIIPVDGGQPRHYMYFNFL